MAEGITPEAREQMRQLSIDYINLTDFRELNELQGFMQRRREELSQIMRKERIMATNRKSREMSGVLNFELREMIKFRDNEGKDRIGKVTRRNKNTLSVETIDEYGGMTWTIHPRALTKLTKEELVSYRLMGDI